MALSRVQSVVCRASLAQASSRVAALLVAVAVLSHAEASAAPPAADPAPAATPPAAVRPTVAVSVAPQRWLVERLAGEAVKVHVVMDASANHETYQPSDREASEVQKASLYFAIGLPLERSRWFAAVRSRVKVIDCAAGVPPRTLEGHVCGEHGHNHDHDHEHDHGATRDEDRDPHMWTSPAALKVQARTMHDALRALLPAEAPRLDERLATLVDELDALDTELRHTLEPCRGKAIIVLHPSWGYFTDAYGLTQIAIEQEGRLPTDAELTRVQQEARSRGVKVVFVEPQFGGRAAEAVAHAIGGRVETIDPLAPDLPANLRRVADLIAESCR